MNHHFELFNSAEDSFAEKNGQVNAQPAVSVMLGWLAKVFAAPQS